MCDCLSHLKRKRGCLFYFVLVSLCFFPNYSDNIRQFISVASRGVMVDIYNPIPGSYETPQHGPIYVISSPTKPWFLGGVSCCWSTSTTYSFSLLNPFMDHNGWYIPMNFFYSHHGWGRNLCSKPPGSWKNVISLGDGPAERRALQERPGAMDGFSWESLKRNGIFHGFYYQL